MEPSPRAKALFFQQLEANWDDDSDTPDVERTELMKKYRAARLRREAAQRDAQRQPGQPSSQEQTHEPASSQVDETRTDKPEPVVNPRRTKPAAPTHIPKDPRDKVIKGTPLHKTALSNTCQATSAAPTSFIVIEDTPPVAATRRVAAASKSSMLRRSATTPLPASSASAAPESPSISAADMGKKKRKRNSDAGKAKEVLPESRQVFKGLTFYYIPDNDIAKARRIRMEKAEKYGARRVRAPELATHVMVDRSLVYGDIESIVGPALLESRDAGKPIFIVEENYQGDCIEHGTVLNAENYKYRISGTPLSPRQELVKSKFLSSTSRIPATLSQDVSSSSQESLQIKTGPPTKRTRMQHNSLMETPPREEPPDSQGHRKIFDEIIVASSTGSSSRSGQIRSTEPEARPGPSPELGSADELTSYIEMMAKYKHLPLDDDEDGTAAESATESVISDDDNGSGSEEERNHKRWKAAAAYKRNRKEVKWEDAFACHRGGTRDSRGKSSSTESNPNARTIEILQEMCNYYSRIDDHWRTTAYRKAIKTLQRQTDHRITTADEASRLPGIGSRLAQKIEEIATTNRLQRLEHAQNEPMDAVLQLFLGIYGVGLTQARRWIAQGFRTLDDLRQRPEARLTRNQRMGLDRYDDLNTRIPRREVEALGALVRREAAVVDDSVELLIGGSYRRGAESSGDADFIVTRRGTSSTDELVPFLERLLARLTDMGVIVATVSALHAEKAGSSKWHGCCVLPEGELATEGEYRSIWRRVDFLLVPETEYGAALIYFTGNDIFNRSMRLLASKKGMRLNQRGLFAEVMRGPGRAKVTEGRLLEGSHEKRIFELLGVKWREPWERWC